MIEIRYNKVTKEVTGWCREEAQFGNLDRKWADEAVVIIDAIPTKHRTEYTFDKDKNSLVLTAELEGKL